MIVDRRMVVAGAALVGVVFLVMLARGPGSGGPAAGTSAKGWGVPAGAADMEAARKGDERVSAAAQDDGAAADAAVEPAPEAPPRRIAAREPVHAAPEPKLKAKTRKPTPPPPKPPAAAVAATPTAADDDLVAAPSEPAAAAVLPKAAPVYSAHEVVPSDGRVPEPETADDDVWHALAPGWPASKAKPTELPPLPTAAEPTGANPYGSPWLERLDKGIVAGPLSGDIAHTMPYAKSQLFVTTIDLIVPQPPYSASVFAAVHKHDWLLKGVQHVYQETNPKGEPLLWSPKRYTPLTEVEGMNHAQVKEVWARGGQKQAVLMHVHICDVFKHYDTYRHWPERFAFVMVGDGNFGLLSDNLRHTSPHNSMESRIGGCAPSNSQFPYRTTEHAHEAVLHILNTVPNLVAWIVNQDTGVLHPKLHAIALGPGEPEQCDTLIRNTYGLNNLWQVLADTLVASAAFAAKFHTLSVRQQRDGTRPYLLYINHSGWRHRGPIDHLIIRTFAEASRQAGSKGELWLRNEYNFQPNAQVMAEMRDAMLKHKYVLSPMGAGQDTYRHWEALLLGCIPVMTHSSLDHTFVDLPVLLVDDYAQVTPQLLLAEYPKIIAKREKYNYSKLTAQYWRHLPSEMKKRPPINLPA